LFLQYFKMMKMGLPVGAVKNAIERDGKDPTVMDLDPEKSIAFQRGGGGGAKEEELVDTGPPLRDDPDYSKVSHCTQQLLICSSASFTNAAAGLRNSTSKCSRWGYHWALSRMRSKEMERTRQLWIWTKTNLLHFSLQRRRARLEEEVALVQPVVGARKRKRKCAERRSIGLQ
jgi:hypothetical protein